MKQVQIIYINHARWHRCLRVSGNRETRRKLTCPTWWPHKHLTYRRRVLNLGRSGERRSINRYASQQLQKKHISGQ